MQDPETEKESELSLQETIDGLPDIAPAPMCERCVPYGRCQGLSQIENEDWFALEACIDQNDFSTGDWDRLQKKYHYLELDRIKVRPNVTVVGIEEHKIFEYL